MANNIQILYTHCSRVSSTPKPRGGAWEWGRAVGGGGEGGLGTIFKIFNCHIYGFVLKKKKIMCPLLSSALSDIFSPMTATSDDTSSQVVKRN